MIPRRIVFGSIVAALMLPSAPAGAELTPWDQAKVSAVAEQLVPATGDLYDTFYKQPPPTAGSGQTRSYHRLKQKVRHLQSDARQLSGSLGKGEGYDETLPIYENMMQVVRSAREDARQVFQTSSVSDKATAVRALLNQLGPYYDPDYEALQPTGR